LPGYRFRDLKYTVSFKGGGGPYGHRTVEGRGKVVGSFVDAGSSLIKFAHDFGVERNVNKRLEEIYPKIKRALENHTGVLVVVQYQIWEFADPDFNPPELLSVMLGPAASNLPSAIRKWEQKSKLVQGPSEGKVFGPQKYLWFTQDLKNKDELKRTEALNIEE
jgi:hypothetical protein